MEREEGGKMKMRPIPTRLYGLADLTSRSIQFRGNLVECYHAALGRGDCAIYRSTSTGWLTVAVQYGAKPQPVIALDKSFPDRFERYRELQNEEGIL
jgi:hypothetical protein